MMIGRLVVIVILFISSTTYVDSQRRAGYRSVPLTEVIPVMVVQEDSPILIERFFLALNETTGRVESFYRVRNRSSKVIKSYTIARWFSDDTGFLGEGAMPNRFLHPGELTGNYDVPIKVASAEASSKPLKKIAFIMVTEAVFTDNTRFDATRGFTGLENYIERGDLTGQSHSSSVRK